MKPTIGKAQMLLNKKIVLFFVASLLAHAGICQRTIDWNYETWWGLMTSTRVAKRFSIYNDFHYSKNLFVAYRTGLTYHPKSDNFVTTVAYAYLELTAPFSDGKLVRPEHRPWMQIIYRVPSTKRISTSFRFKYDARFIRDLEADSLADSYSFNHRWRFNNALRYNFPNGWKKGTQVNAVMLNESFITTGPGPNGAPFEHRTHLLGEVSKGHFVFSTGYMVRYLAFSPDFARFTHGPIFWLTINLNLLKNNQTPFLENPEDHAE